MLQYLALGDSYTIGEQVATEDNFPHQTAQLLHRTYHIDVAAPEIIAITGWTTDELDAAIREKNPHNNYDLVTLLIGVNNQYRGRDVHNYAVEFSVLLQQAIQFAKGNPGHVFVLSIPDWGVTPFAADRDTATIAKEIDSYNVVNQTIAAAAGCHYLDITPATRMHAKDESYLAEDRLHYSQKEYALWAEQLAYSIHKALT